MALFLLIPYEALITGFSAVQCQVWVFAVVYIRTSGMMVHDNKSTLKHWPTHIRFTFQIY